MPSSDPLDELLDSLRGSRRAQPPADLLARIRVRTDASVVHLRPRWQRQAAAAAAVALLALNGWAMYQQLSPAPDTADQAPALFDSYQLYD